MTPKKAAPEKAAAKKAPSKAVEKAGPLRVPSTRVDGPGTALAVREPMAVSYGTVNNAVTVTVTHTNPAFTGVITVQGTIVLPFTNGTATVTVDASALGAIESLGFEVTIGAPGPAPAYDANLDTVTAPIVSNAASLTNAALRAAIDAEGTAQGWGAVADATTSTKGVITLAGDLAGTAASPTVAKINGATPAAVATSGAYADLSGKPTIPAVYYLNAADYGFLPTATAAANNAALTAATSAALAAGRSLYIPGHGSGSPYTVSAPMDLSAGQVNVFGDPGETFIYNTLNTSALVKCGGTTGRLADISFQHTTAIDANTGNGIEVNDCSNWTFEQVAVYGAGYAFKQTGGAFFSNYMQGLSLRRFYSGGIRLTSGTGSVWDNTYINNVDSGTGQLCTDHLVALDGNIDESVFNQINIEWAQLSPGKNALLANGQGSVTINALHLEQVQHTGFNGAYIVSNFKALLIVDGMTVKFCDIAPTGSQGGGRVLLHATGASIDARGVYSAANSNTTAQAAQLATTDSDAASRISVTAITNDLWTSASAGAGLRRVGDPIFVQKAGALTATDLPYSGMVGVDTTNSKFYVNVAGTVKGVTLA